ncbi:MAG: glycosyltransferase family 4 protein [Acidobacteriota bacterium]
MQPRSSARQWHLITCEYPPDIGGIAEHTAALAAQLVKLGDSVHVWTSGDEVDPRMEHGLELHRQLGQFSPRRLRRAGAALNAIAPSTHLVVQWVPHGYGMWSMNLIFCAWLLARRRRGDVIELFVHEPSMPFGRGIRQNVLAVMHRLMMTVLLLAAHRVWMVIPGWETRIKPYLLRRKTPLLWLPIISGAPVIEDVDAVQSLRREFGAEGTVIAGHLGLGTSIEDGMLEAALPNLSTDPSVSVLLIGKSSEELRARLLERVPALAARLYATGPVDARDLSLALQACDVMLQPYPDGVSGRRTSTLNALRHGLPLVTTTGALTEPLWKEAGITLSPAGDRMAFAEAASRLLASGEERAAAGERSAALFRKTFEPSALVAKFRSVVIGGDSSRSGDTP